MKTWTWSVRHLTRGATTLDIAIVRHLEILIVEVKQNLDCAINENREKRVNWIAVLVRGTRVQTAVAYRKGARPS